jgi:hypothetical protein
MHEIQEILVSKVYIAVKNCKLYIDPAYVAVECFHPLVMEFLSQFETISTFEKRKKSIGVQTLTTIIRTGFPVPF